jgi:hypothetical protein
MVPKGLSLLQAPPFSTVALLFICGLIFGTLGPVLFMFTEAPLPAMVHLFTLGFAANIMIGALFQMLPVVVGAIITNPKPKAFLTALFLNTGTGLLLTGFYTDMSILYLVAVVFLSLGIFPISLLMLYKLLSVKSYTPTSWGMRYALMSFILGAIVGILYLLGSRAILEVPLNVHILEFHIDLMLLGWVGVLIVSVAFQVIEMFFITPPYPRIVYRILPPSAVLLIFIKFFTGSNLINPLIAVLFLTFSLLTVKNLISRRRKIPDPVVYLWITGMVLLSLAMLTYGLAPFTGFQLLAFLFLYGCFVLSVIMAMLYRIVPFLVWFHLSNEGLLQAPTMHEVIPNTRVWKNFYLHLIATATGLLSLTGFLDYRLSFLAFFVSLFMLALNVIAGIGTYYRLSPKT